VGVLLTVMASGVMVAFATMGSAGVDPGFASQPLTFGAQTFPRAIVGDASGRVLVGGSGTINTDTGFVVRLLPDGSRDPAFGTMGVVSLPSGVSALAIDASGRILVGGGSTSGAFIERLDESGTPDPSFGVAGVLDPIATPSGVVEGLAVDANGLIDVVYNVSFTDVRLVRLTSSGGIDPGFSGPVSTGFSAPGDLAFGSSGRIYVSGGNGSDAAVLALKADGTTDASFGTNGIATVDAGASESGNALAAVAGGGVVVGGR
jgi:uncharacterized delta-60 repeat protein